MLYPRAMGAAFKTLPAPLQAFHGEGTDVLYRGRVTVTHGSALMRRVAKAGGMPGKSGEMPFTFRVTRDGETEIWERDFGGHITRSHQWLHSDGVVAERVGTSTFLMQPKVNGLQLHIPIIGARGFGMPLPFGVFRSCAGVEGVTPDGNITFDVHASLRGLGLVIRYQGELARIQ